MAAYSVADAKNRLPSLIDKAIAGEKVVITRHGKPVAEIRAAAPAYKPRNFEAYRRLIAERDKWPAIAISSVDLLNEMYDETPW